MRFCLIILMYFFYTASSLAQVDLEHLRKYYYKVDTDSSACNKLYQKIQSGKFTDNILNGYKGAIMCAMAGHSQKKEEKLKLFNEGKKLIEEAIKKDTSNVELRFLRLTIQHGSPKALGYNKKIASDKEFIIRNIGSVKNSVIKKNIIQYLLENLKQELTETQIKKLKENS